MKENLSKISNRLLIRVTSICMLLLATALPIYAQSSISGKVSDEKGNGLAGVTVIVQGTTNGTNTANDGTYTLLNVGKDAIIEFRCLGMADYSCPVNGRTVINAVLKEDTTYLDEVVVVGYGTQQKASLTGSVTQIKGDELLRGPATNVSSVLAGKLTGVSSVQSSGQPGRDQAALKVRGSIYGVNYIVDGMVRSIDDIDPNDIETVSVLKDASAAAVYGLSGAGGVVIITTKKGDVGATQIKYNGSAGVSLNANFPEFLDGPGYAYYYNRARELDGDEPIFTEADVYNMIHGYNGWGNTNWIAKTFGTGVNTNHSVTVQGGTDKVRYFASLGYMNQKGNVQNFDYTRYNARLNLEARIAKHLKFNMGLSGQIGKKNEPGFAAGGTWQAGTDDGALAWYSVAEQAIFAHPYLPETIDGKPTGSFNLYSRAYNPIAASTLSGKFRNNTTKIQTNASLSWEIPWVKGLSASVTGAYDKSITTAKNLSTPYYLMTEILPSELGNGTLYYSGELVDPRSNKANKLAEGAYISNFMTGQASLNYAGLFGKHDIKVLLLGEIRDYTSNNFGAKGKGLDFVELPELGNVLGPDMDSGSPIWGGSAHSRSIGYVGRINYAYDNRYLVELAGRYDGSYKFSGNIPGKRWGFFPSLSVGWRISNEEFFSEAKSVVNDMKIRASVGEVGSDNVKAFSYLSKLAFNSGYTAIFGNNAVKSIYTSAVANPQLTWERQLAYNLGVDATLWNKLLGIEADIFYTYTYDILSESTGYPPSMGGYYPTFVNGNKIDSRGFEISLSHENKIGDFAYGGKFSISWARSRWLKYPDSQGALPFQRVTGKTYNSLLLLEAEGLYQTEEEIDNSSWYDGVRPSLGDIKYKDIDGDGVIDAWKDRTYKGRSNTPEITGSLNLFASFKGFDLNMMFVGGAMFDVALTGIYYNWAMDSTPFTKVFKGGANAPKFLAEQSWRPDNTGGTYPRLSISRTNDNNGLASTFWYRDGKYLRLKTAQIGYSFPKKWISVLGIENLRLYAEGGNLFTIDGLPKGVDPEAPGVNLGYYPQQRTILGGVTITF